MTSTRVTTAAKESVTQITRMARTGLTTKVAVSLPGILFGAILSAVSPLASAGSDPFDPEPEHFQMIYQCLEASRGVETVDVERNCVGLVSEPCLEDPANQTTHGMAGCSRREGVIWDSLLNDWYKSARETMSPNLKTDFRDVQRAWIAWRDEKCGFEHARFEGGTIGIPLSAHCVMETTARRALELRALVIESESY